jgi:HK97 family phage portal protein
VGLVSRLARPRAETDREKLLRAVRGAGGRTKSGVHVTEATAMRVAAVAACARVFAEDVAKLPLILYRRLAGGGKERATDHPRYRLMHDQPNGVQTSFAFREQMQTCIEYRGNAYAFKVRVRGEIRELLPIHPSKVSVRRRDDWEPVYTVDGKEYGRADILHIAGLSDDGVCGLSPITLHRESIGLAMATLEHGAKLFGNGARPSGILEYPGVFSDEAAARLKESFEEEHGGENMLRTALLEDGVTWKAVGLSSEDAQYLETRKFQRSEIAGIWRIPPHKIGDLDKATFSNIEHQSLEYVVDSLMPRLARWEQRLNLDLLTPAEREVYFFEFLVDGLLRGDTKSRNQALEIQRRNGVINADEWREIENRNPLPDGLGKVYITQLNMGPVTPDLDEKE